MSGENSRTNISQLHHRLNILNTWFGGLSSATTTLSGATILEIGCGQGDMTVPLAHFGGKVFGVDPAPRDYGSPLTLGQAQSQISESPLVGRKIEWVRRDPIDYLRESPDMCVDFVVLAHSIFYFPSENYLADLLRALRFFAAKREHEKTCRVLIAEWGMRASNPAAEAHVLAAKAQATNPLADGNVRTVVVPHRIQEIATAAGWTMEAEGWMESPDVEDGEWEVGLANTMACEEMTIERGVEFREMMRAVEQLGDGKIGSMDVWTGVFA